jgi:hypothetical protein
VLADHVSREILKRPIAMRAHAAIDALQLSFKSLAFGFLLVEPRKGCLMPLLFLRQQPLCRISPACLTVGAMPRKSALMSMFAVSFVDSIRPATAAAIDLREFDSNFNLRKPHYFLLSFSSALIASISRTKYGLYGS